jgi:hypothetical protein
MQYYNPMIEGDIVKLGKKNDEFFYHNLRVALNSIDGENSPKVNWIYDFITKEAAAGRKSVVYSNWKKAGMNLIRKRLDALNDSGMYIYISGDVPSEVRKLARRKFNNDENFRKSRNQKSSETIKKNHLEGKMNPKRFKDKKHSDKTKQLISEKMKGMGIGENNSQYGTCWITKDGANKKIKKEEIETYLNEGWLRGRKNN